MTEVEQALKVLQKEQLKIEAFLRLEINQDFQIFLEEVSKKIEELRNLLEFAKDEDLVNVRAQLQALRGLLSLFKMVISRKEEVAEKIKELNNA